MGAIESDRLPTNDEPLEVPETTTTTTTTRPPQTTEPGAATTTPRRRDDHDDGRHRNDHPTVDGPPPSQSPRDQRRPRLVHGASAASSRIGRHLAELAATLRADRATLGRLAACPEDLGTWPGHLGDRIRRFLAEHGHVVMSNDLTQPTWAEDPRPVLALVTSLLHEQALPGGSARRVSEEAEREAREALPPHLVRRFEEALAWARRAQPCADVTEWTVLAAMGAVRLAVEECGRRMAERGALLGMWDVLYLTEGELFDLLAGGAVPSGLADRRLEYRWALTHRGPARYGPTPNLELDTRWFPRRLRAPLEAFMWAARLSLREQSEDTVPSATEGSYRGAPASPGRAVGPVRVVRDPRDFARVQAGDILVCPYALAAWSAIFPLLAGVIAESGGPLSHPAVLTREFSLPAVMGLADATTIFPEGTSVEMDGSTGWVRRLDAR